MSSQSDTDLREAILDLFEAYGVGEPEYNEAELGRNVDKLLTLFQAHEHQLLTELMEQLPEKKDINIIGRIGGYSEEPLYVNGVSPHKARANAGYNYALDQVTALLEQKLQQRNDGGDSE